MVCNGTKLIFAECTPVEPGSRTGTAYGHLEPLARKPGPRGTCRTQWCLPVRKQHVGVDAPCNATEKGERTPASTVATARIARNRRMEATKSYHITRECDNRTGTSLARIPAQTRRIITSVALMRAAAVCPGFSCISRADRAVIMDVIC